MLFKLKIKIPKAYAVVALLLIPVVLLMCRKAGEFPDSDFDPRLSGGQSTVFDATSQAFGHTIPGLNDADQHAHDMGDGEVEQIFVTAPAPVNSGLGPAYNNASCESCHHNDGKGSPTAGLVNSSLLIRLSISRYDYHGGALDVPGFGTQLQDKAVFNVQPEARVNISYAETPFIFPDGYSVSLRAPTYTLTNPYMPLPGNYMLSPRLAPPFFGVGLLESIPESTILSFADENDANGDGISGRPNYVWDSLQQKIILGRFGLKANSGSIAEQVAAAFQQDMGITTSAFRRESTFGQAQFDGLADDPELPDSLFNGTVFYIRTLAVPARRDVTDPQVLRGENLFKIMNCSGCHIPTIQTGVVENLPALSNQRIHPYTDLLLHDMGPGLADNRPDFRATGTEWKTPALWGVGLFQKTNGTPFYLHDGRARTPEEAILWHGGEAQHARDQFAALNTADRNALISFLKSL